MNNNVFEFNGTFLLQNSGKAIGTKIAPSYANIFMSIFEEHLQGLSSTKPAVWLRFIDDIFLVWTEGPQKFLDFMQLINAQHPNIKFTFDYSQSSVHFLDVTIFKDLNGPISTDLFVKPTDTH